MRSSRTYRGCERASREMKHVRTAYPSRVPPLALVACGAALLAAVSVRSGEQSPGSASRAVSSDGAPGNATPGAGTYVVVDTAQTSCYDDTGRVVSPGPGQPFYGQDAQFRGPRPAYRDNGNGTVTDLNTGLMWQKDPGDKVTWAQAVAGAATCRTGGYSDWRLPTIKQLYSLIEFSGVSGFSAADSKPYLDTRYFDFQYGNTNAGERLIDAQYWSSTEYVGTTMNGIPTAFGVNFADGRIKGYGKRFPWGGVMYEFVRYVRGNPSYGVNQFVGNHDGTVTDNATGLMWEQADSGRALNWEQALAYAQSLRLAGYSDWRLPNAKELQSIVDYTRAPTVTGSAAIDTRFFQVTDDESWYWTSTTHLDGPPDRRGSAAVYICFGRAFGCMGGEWLDVHGAGAQRGDPKSGDPAWYPYGRGPQGDQIRIYNYVRAVRGGL